MSTPHGPERREQSLRRSGAAGPHDDRQTRTEAVRRALADQEAGEEPCLCDTAFTCLAPAHSTFGGF